MLQRLDDGPDLGQRMIANQHQVDLLLLEQSRIAAEFAEGLQWEDEGFNTPIDWIRFNCHLTEKMAGDRIAVGQEASRLTQSVEAVEAGEIGFAHLSVIARTAQAVGKAVDEYGLLELARKLSPGKLYFQCQHYRHSVDATAYAVEQADAVEARRLHLSTAEDGCLLINGVLDPIGGAAVRTALEPLARPSGAHDDRELPKRYADALVELASHGGNRKVQMQVTSSIETLLGLVGAPGAENEFSLPISSKTVERWACDCNISRVLLQDSLVIDVGRSVRTTKGPRRRALNARDKHCQWPGCERPASWCDAHHLVHYFHGGGGEIENQTLLCHRHHWLVHEGNWQLVKADDGEIMAIAPTITFAPPRGPD